MPAVPWNLKSMELTRFPPSQARSYQLLLRGLPTPKCAHVHMHHGHSQIFIIPPCCSLSLIPESPHNGDADGVWDEDEASHFIHCRAGVEHSLGHSWVSLHIFRRNSFLKGILCEPLPVMKFYLLWRTLKRNMGRWRVCFVCVCMCAPRSCTGKLDYTV